MKEWNDCYLFKEEPKKELEEIKIDDFTLSYEEFKSLLDNGLLSNQYYPNYHISDPNEQEAILDRMMPSMSKDGIFNMMNYNLAKHSSISDKVELHYAGANKGTTSFAVLSGFYNLINNEVVEESKIDGKVHFILTDGVEAKDKIKSGHVTPYIVMNGEVFEFDSIWELGLGSEYHTKYLQQSDSTSCKTIAIREVDNFLKMLEDFNSIQEFSNYLKQFFSENKREYYIDPDTGDLIEGPKNGKDKKESDRNRRLAILPFPILKNSQSLSSLKKTLEFIQNLEKKQEDLPETEKEEFIKKYKHILEMKDKLEKLINRFEVQKKIRSKNEIKTASVSAYTLKERLRQAKVLAILLEKGKIKSLKNVEEYNKSAENGKVAVATVDKELVKEINKTEDNIKNRENRISENNELNIEKEKTENKNINEEQKVDTENYNGDIELKLEEQDKKNEINEEEINKDDKEIKELQNKLREEREKTKSTIIHKVFNFFSKTFFGREIIYETEREKELNKELNKKVAEKEFREQFYTPTITTEQQILNQNELSQQNILNELDNKKENEIKEQGI